MGEEGVWLEIIRWGFAEIPAVAYAYADELGFGAEDLGILGAVMLAMTRQTHPVLVDGITIEQVLQVYPALGRARLMRRLARWEELGLVRIEDQGKKDWHTRRFCIEPMLSRIEELVRRDHPQLSAGTAREQEMEARVREYEEKIRLLEERLAEQEVLLGTAGTETYRQIADFIARKTGNLLSARMSRELRIWIDEMGLEKQYLLAMLELCFERSISNPREITAIAKGLKEASITNLDGMEAYFKNKVDREASWRRLYNYDPELSDFAVLVGIDMNAEARRRIYYKWRHDWGFSREMVTRAGEIMCKRTQNGGLEYIDSVLSSWKAKNISTLEQVEEELALHRKNKTRSLETPPAAAKKQAPKDRMDIYVPPAVIERLKSSS